MTSARGFRLISGPFFVVCAAAVLVVASAGPALAAKRKVGVSLNGTPAGPVRQGIADSLKRHGFEPVVPDQSPDSEAEIAALARKLRLAAVIVGEVRDGGRKLKLRVYSSAGQPIGEGSWTERAGPKKLGTAVEHGLWSHVGKALERAHAGGGGGGGEGRARAEPPAAESDTSDTGATSSDDKGDKDEKDEKGEKDEKEAKDDKSAADESDGEAEAPRQAAKGKKGRRAAAKESAQGDAADGGDGEGAAPALELAVGPRALGRRLSWTNNASGDLLNYKLGYAPSVGLTLAWYPAAHFQSGWLSNVGLALSGEYTPGLTSKTMGGVTFPTQESDFWAGLRGRLPLGSVEPALTVGAGQHGFTFKSQGGASRADLSGLPDVAYTYVRVGGDVRVKLPANLSLALGAAYRVVLNAGDKNYFVGSDAFFPGVKVGGLEGSLGVGYRILPFLEVRAGADLRRYSLTTNRKADATFSATAGTDQYVAFWAHLAVFVGGSDGASHREAASPPPAE
jgi:hypothetical protein